MLAAITRTSTRDSFGRAQPLHFLLLQKAQQLGLHAERQFTHLVEKKRSPVRRRNAPHLRLHRSRERPPGMAKQFRLQQRLGNGGAVHRDRKVSPTAGSGRAARCATSSLPLPVAPAISTVVVRGATSRASR